MTMIMLIGVVAIVGVAVVVGIIVALSHGGRRDEE